MVVESYVWLAAWIVVGGSAVAPRDSPDRAAGHPAVVNHQQYREAAADFLVAASNAFAESGLKDYRPAFRATAQLVLEMSDEDIAFLATGAPKAATMRMLTDRVQAPMASALASRVAGAKAIEVSVMDTDPAFCADFPAELGYTALATKVLAEQILKALEFTCQESVLGTNVALACVVPEETFAAAEIISENYTFCFDQIRGAAGASVLQTEYNIASHLNEFVDESLSSRVSQDTVDLVQDSVDLSADQLDVTEPRLSDGFGSIASQLSDTLASLDNLDAVLTALVPTATDAQFRSQVNQVNIEDAQLYAASIEAAADEVRDNTQALIAAYSSVESTLVGVAVDLELAQDLAERDAIALDMASTLSSAADFALPIAYGGRLEIARELLIEAIAELDMLGLQNTDDARDLLTQGDDAYNAGDYALAYQRFSQAYQALVP